MEEPDAGVPDLRSPDAGAPDVSAPDAGPPDVGVPDVGPDAGLDAGAPSSPPLADPLVGEDAEGCTATGSGGSLWVLLGLLGLFMRRLRRFDGG